MVLSMGVGSYLLISLSFRTALDREVGVAREEMQMLRITYEAVCSARGVTLENLGDAAQSLHTSTTTSPSTTRFSVLW